MKDFWKKHKTCLSISIYLVAVGLIGFFVARPVVSAIREKSNQIQQKIALQEGKEKKLKELPSIRSQFEKVKNQEEKINISLNEENVVSLVEKLEKISEETGNKIKMELPENGQDSGKNSKEEKDSLAESLPSDKYVKMKISLYGSYSGFLNFLNKVENVEFYSDVISIAVRRASESGPGLSNNPFTGMKNLSNEENSSENNDKINSQLIVVFYLENK